MQCLHRSASLPPPSLPPRAAVAATVLPELAEDAIVVLSFVLHGKRSAAQLTKDRSDVASILKEQASTLKEQANTLKEQASIIKDLSRRLERLEAAHAQGQSARCGSGGVQGRRSDCRA